MLAVLSTLCEFLMKQKYQKVGGWGERGDEVSMINTFIFIQNTFT